MEKPSEISWSDTQFAVTGDNVLTIFRGNKKLIHPQAKAVVKGMEIQDRIEAEELQKAQEMAGPGEVIKPKYDPFVTYTDLGNGHRTSVVDPLIFIQAMVETYQLGLDTIRAPKAPEPALIPPELGEKLTQCVDKQPVLAVPFYQSIDWLSQQRQKGILFPTPQIAETAILYGLWMYWVNREDAREQQEVFEENLSAGFGIQSARLYRRVQWLEDDPRFISLAERITWSKGTTSLEDYADVVKTWIKDQHVPINNLLSAKATERKAALKKKKEEELPTSLV